MSSGGSSEERVDFRAVAELQSDLVFRLDATGRLQYVSRGAERFFGRSRARAEGAHFSEFLPEADLEEAERVFDRLLDGEPVDGVALELADGDGEVRAIQITAEPVVEDGAVTGARGVAVDVTARRDRERRLERQRDDLDRHNRINATLREVQAAIVDAETEHEVVTRVCDRLADAWFYTAAWYGESADGRVVPVVAAGTDRPPERVAPTDLTGRGEGASPAERLADGEVVVGREGGPGPDVSAMLSEPMAGAAASALLPVVADGTLRGVLGLLAPRASAFDEWEREVLGDLGAVIGDALSAAEARHEARLFRRVMDRSDDAVFIVDPADGSLVDVNGGACRQLGYDRDALLDRHIWEVSANMAAAEWDDWVARLTADQHVFEGTHRTATGDLVPVEVRAETVTLDDDRYIVGLARDVSEQRELENEVVELTRELRTILDNAPVVVFRLDPDGSFTRWAGRGLDRLPLSREERDGLSLDRLQSESAVENCRRALDGETVRDTVEFGGRHWEAWYQPCYEDGEVTGAICFALDVTADRRRAQAVEVLDRVLRHNLRNRMNVVVGEAARMVDEADDVDVGRAGRRIVDAGEELLGLADAARDIQEVVTDEPQFDPSDPVAVTRAVCDRLLPEYPDAELAVDLMDDRVVVPGAGLDIAVRELVENALKHAGPGASVTVSLACPHPGTARLEVADDGPGLPAMEQAVLRDGAKGPLAHGQGLGLWLVRWVVSEADGRLAIDADSGSGTAVTVDLPTVGEEPPGSAGEPDAADADD